LEQGFEPGSPVSELCPIMFRTSVLNWYQVLKCSWLEKSKAITGKLMMDSKVLIY